MVAFQLIAVWAIVIATLVWFVRDERRIRDKALDRAARFYAQAPQYRYVPPHERRTQATPRKPVRSAAGEEFARSYAALSGRSPGSP
jgi:hypothetical protein